MPDPAAPATVPRDVVHTVPPAAATAAVPGLPPVAMLAATSPPLVGTVGEVLVPFASVPGSLLDAGVALQVLDAAKPAKAHPTAVGRLPGLVLAPPALATADMLAAGPVCTSEPLANIIEAATPPLATVDPRSLTTETAGMAATAAPCPVKDATLLTGKASVAGTHAAAS
mmetsp:Transcript_89001/g.276971  ORF Transcript_89001/g.276971 Transcript_89001/m.276971 type:complete len:170 (+) Transcript_89001:281-790(+)